MSSDRVVSKLCERVIAADDSEVAPAGRELRSALRAHMKDLKIMAAKALLQPCPQPRRTSTSRCGGLRRLLDSYDSQYRAMPSDPADDSSFSLH